MREILFRGKRDPKYGDGWCFGVPYIDHDGDCILANDCSKSVVVEETVGQFTGLTDKNGKRIFEGDIIRNIDNGDIGVIRWYIEHGAFVIRRISDNQIFWLFDNNFSKIEIIGNIHDNPESLKKGE